MNEPLILQLDTNANRLHSNEFVLMVPSSSARVKSADEEKLPLQMPEFTGRISCGSIESSSIVTKCPGKAAARRLRQFDQCWSRKSARSLNITDGIMQVNVDDVIVKRLLGNGGFSTVSRVYVRNATTGNYLEQSFAMKKLKARHAGDFSSSTIAASDFALETKILRNLSHENIISLRGVKAGDMIQSLKEGSFFIILDEMVETLDVRLQRWSTRTKKNLFRNKSIVSTNRRLREVAVGVANGMAYLHSKNIMFR